MSFVGRLDQFKLTDVLQILAMGEKSGKIKLTQRDADGVIVLQRGRIIYAASSSARETLGHILISEQMITEEQLMKALEMQHKAIEEKRLGACLIEVGALDEETLEWVVTKQIEKVITELMAWKGGYFKFEAMDLRGPSEIGVDAENLLLVQGLSAERILLNAGAEVGLDETQELLAADVEMALRAETLQSNSTSAEEGLSALKAIMREIRSASLTGEATSKILNYAARALPRVVLFVVRHEDFAVMGQQGVDADLSLLRIPARAASVLNQSAELKETWRGVPDRSPANAHLVEAMGEAWPGDAVVIPMVLEDRVHLLVYGDDGGTGSIGSVAELELLVLQVALATEKNLLEKRLEQLQASRAADA